jgi:hypothetical protein
LDEFYKRQRRVFSSSIITPRTLDQQLRDAIEKKYPSEELQRRFGKQDREPKHVLTIHKQFIEDFKSLDIPVFYNRSGETDLMDSKGQRVEVQNLQNRKEYFGEDPFEAIKREQIDGLGQNRITELMNDIFSCLKAEFDDKARAAFFKSIKKRS